ncbi:fructosamine kinase PKL/CAK/FruK [Lactarius akahatsu]|uniref:protein-ribulosamine 3-kinase n=1 Tax=Lactarius akahatsu TaxID=416441 RepID=A0AAD4LML7_9AGAM|nr:fructosamine kinase PKL/CAK/FruK [Lactarius akahatsu]
MARSAIPPHLLKQLERIEPGAHFSGKLPQVFSSSGKSYYAKCGSPREIEQYVGEAESLKAMGSCRSWSSPFFNGEETESSEGSPFFVSEYREITPLTERTGAILGRRLATEMHRYTSSKGYGFDVPTFCGATRLRNGCVSTHSYGILLSTLTERRKYSELCRKGQDVRTRRVFPLTLFVGAQAYYCRVIPALLGPLQIKPVLLHGDLWSGNTGTDATTGEPVIFDPSSLYGHNEADLAIGRMFGGIPSSFFETYHQHMPKTEPAEQYDLRGDLYELFHYLNHTVLFGGGYADSALRKMEKLLRVYS